MVCRPQGIAVAYKLYDYPLLIFRKGTDIVVSLEKAVEVMDMSELLEDIWIYFIGLYKQIAGKDRNQSFPGMSLLADHKLPARPVDIQVMLVLLLFPELEECIFFSSVYLDSINIHNYSYNNCYMSTFQ